MPEKKRSQIIQPICLLLKLPTIAGTIQNDEHCPHCAVASATHSHNKRPHICRQIWPVVFLTLQDERILLFTAKQKQNVFYIIFTLTSSFIVLISFYSIVANYLDVTSTRLVCQTHARSAAGAVLMRPYSAGRITQLLKQIGTWIMEENFLFATGTPVQKAGTCLEYIPKEWLCS